MAYETVLSLLRKSTDFFEEKGIDEAKRSAEHLLAHAMNKSRLQLFLDFDKPVSDQELQLFRALIRRRLANEPVQYIVGSVEFYGLEFIIAPPVLIPRPETEHLVEAVIDYLRDKTSATRVLDIGTGSGCIAVALASHVKHIRIIATDVDARALDVANANSLRHGVAERVTFLQHDIRADTLQQLDAPFDVVVSNPPYIAAADVDELQAEIRLHEAATALTDHGDGLGFFRAIAAHSAALLATDAMLAVEIAYGQAEAVRDILSTAGLKDITVLSDYSGIQRVVLAKRSG